MIKQIKTILFKEEKYPKNYGRIGQPEELHEHNIWLTIMNLCNAHNGKKLTQKERRVLGL